MNFVKATRQFENWLGHRTELVKQDLRTKHASMKTGVFPFLRATYYRWAQLWPQVCPDLAKAPQVLAVGDLHVENFGTWRDVEGRLIWGVNDFDECHPLAYANDLVRIAVSAHLAVEAGHLPLKKKDICDALLVGYRDGLHANGLPFVLGERNEWLRQIAESKLRDPIHFWAKIDALPTVRGRVPSSATDAIERLLPTRKLTYRLAKRVAGLGSLGHARYVAIADWNGGRIAREAKAIVQSACCWAGAHKESCGIMYETLLEEAVRCPDPFVRLRGRWIVRRLSPHCSRIEIATLQAQGEELRLLCAMGWETANIHLGTKGAQKKILAHVQRQKPKWLHGATEQMLNAVRQDWKVWEREGYA